MSVSYSAVGWNRQKKLYDGIIAAFCITYLILFAGFTWIFNAQVTFETLIIRSASTLAVILLHIILAIGPLCRLQSKFLPLLYNRRHLGVTMFFLAAIHGVFSILQFHALGNIHPLLSVFVSNTNYDSLAAFPFQAPGFIALIILMIMAVTSHDFWLHNLSPRLWKTLHMFVYMAYALVVMHVMLGVIQYEQNPLLVILVFTGSISLIVLHLLAAQKERKTDEAKLTAKQDGFVMVCKITDIENTRAKIFCVEKERIAVYRHEDRIYAIHNVCKHQGGPLGEGRILDGCITCPWHGYQYLPHNGQSPPPFKEKVSTYAIKIIHEEIWLNPQPFPEGTTQTGAKSDNYGQ
ncbi:MAG: ferric reductase-like transmembrane domain-containing protein [Bacteroidetes bacterium]|nr:ferric reductase-like transmembrane domain-containing protein [Bacteroidota bacterium]